MRDLNEIRADIDQVDRELVNLYEKRMNLTEQVAEYKISAGKKVFDPVRERQKLDSVTELVSDETLKRGGRELFEQLMSMSRKRQYQLMLEKGVAPGITFEEVEKLPQKQPRIVYQGVEGAYSHLAMRSYFEDSSNNYHVETWRDAMEAIASGEADYAVLPIENSTAGSVSENYDLLAEYDHYIIGEQIVKVEHCLLGCPGATLEDIDTVYSHPQALMQCSGYLEEHRSWESKSQKNTAGSALKVKEDGKKNQAAIASSLTAELYGLDILQQGIQDNANNCTRFVIVTGKKIYLKGAGKISLCFEIPHTSGSLYRILSHFMYNDINMTKIESRPMGERNGDESKWEYRFFVDIEGNLQESSVQNALQGLREEAENLRILGNY